MHIYLRALLNLVAVLFGKKNRKKALRFKRKFI